ncbi:TPA: hypothetical protein AB5E11_003556, partial [Vibrio cholerae]
CVQRIFGGSMVTNLSEYRNSSTKNSESYNSTNRNASNSNNVAPFSKECAQKAKARENLLRAAQKIRW